MSKSIVASTVLRFINVAAGYGSTPVFRALSFSLASGEGACIVGPNGCGKSTVLRCLLGLADMHSGSIEVLGIDAKRIPRDTFATLGVGYVPQGRGDFPSLTVEENIRLAALRSSTTASGRIIDRVFDEVRFIAPLRSRQVGKLSGGERTLVALARALVHRPALRLLVLDEVSSGLSPSNMDLVGKLLTRVRGEGTAILLAEQNRSFARSIRLPFVEAVWETERGSSMLRPREVA